MKIKRSNKRSPDEMWELISEMGWEIYPDYKIISKNGFTYWGNTLMEYIREFAADRVSELYGRVRNYELDTHTTLQLGSDDSVNDLLWHVVGCGKIHWLAAMREPILLKIRAQASNYKESFSYCFQEPEPIENSNSLMLHLVQHLPLTTSVPFKLFGTSYMQIGNNANCCICLMPCETAEQRDIIQHLLNCWNSQPGIIFPSKH